MNIIEEVLRINFLKEGENMAKVLFIASNYGLWGEELQAPWDACKKAGFENHLATYMGVTPLPLLNSTVPDFRDLVTNQLITPREVANRVNEILDNGEWNHPIRTKDANMDDYDTIVLVGGQGSFFDIVGNVDVINLIIKAYKSGKVVAALCAPVVTLSIARNPDTGASLMKGKRSAAHPREWDYSFDVRYTIVRTTADNRGTSIITPGFLFPIQNVIEDATGDPKLVSANVNADRDNPVVVWDKPFLTGQSIESGRAFGNKLVEILKARGL